MNPKPKSNNKPKHLRPQELVLESQIVSSNLRNWCGVVVSRNIERPNELNTPPITHHFINLMTKRGNSGQPVRQISRFADLSFEGEYEPGGMFVIAAGVPGFFSWTTIDHTLTLAIELEHLRRVAEESFGMNAQKVKLNGRINLRDGNIERLAYLFNDELERDAANGALYVD